MRKRPLQKRGVALRGVALRGVALRGVALRGVALRGVALRGVLGFLVLMVTCCVCFDVSFSRLKQVAGEHDVKDMDELRGRIVFGEKCGLCLPFVARMLQSGETEFEIDFEGPGDEQESAT